MKKSAFSIPELFYIMAFFLWLLGSSLTHILNGVELSLWIMTFAVLINLAATTFPWLGIRWLRLEKQGCLMGQRLALCLQVASWGVFAYAMFLRLGRNLPRFHTLITLITLLWAAWLFIFIYSRHACQPKPREGTLREDTPPHGSINRKREDS